MFKKSVLKSSILGGLNGPLLPESHWKQWGAKPPNLFSRGFPLGGGRLDHKNRGFQGRLKTNGKLRTSGWVSKSSCIKGRFSFYLGCPLPWEAPHIFKYVLRNLGPQALADTIFGLICWPTWGSGQVRSQGRVCGCQNLGPAGLFVWGSWAASSGHFRPILGGPGVRAGLKQIVV